MCILDNKSKTRKLASLKVFYILLAFMNTLIEKERIKTSTTPSCNRPPKISPTSVKLEILNTCTKYAVVCCWSLKTKIKLLHQKLWAVVREQTKTVRKNKISQYLVWKSEARRLSWHQYSNPLPNVSSLRRFLLHTHLPLHHRVLRYSDWANRQCNYAELQEAAQNSLNSINCLNVLNEMFEKCYMPNTKWRSS